MKKHTYLSFLAAILAVVVISCNPARRIQRHADGPKDAAATTVQVSPGMQLVELDRLKNILSDLDQQRITDFSTLKAKVKLNYDSEDQSTSATANIRLKKDSIIWVSLTGPFAIEGARIMIRPDSLILMNKLKHTITRRPISYLEEIAGMPISFQDMQNIILGNPLFTDGAVRSFSHDRTRWVATLQSDVFSSILELTNHGHQPELISNSIEQEQGGNTRTCHISYSDYQARDSVRMAMKRNIKVVDVTTRTIELQFKEIQFNIALRFPFSIPKNYKRL